MFMQLVLANPVGNVMEKLHNSKVLESFEMKRLYLTVGEAVADITTPWKTQTSFLSINGIFWDTGKRMMANTINISLEALELGSLLPARNSESVIFGRDKENSSFGSWVILLSEARAPAKALSSIFVFS